MAVTRATVRLKTLSEDPKNDFVNVWHFSTGFGMGANGSEVPTGELVALGTFLSVFYRDAFSTFGAKCLDPTANVHKIDFANVTAGTPGPEDDVMTQSLGSKDFTLAGHSDAVPDLPSEVAICMSYSAQAEAVPEEEGLTRPKARRRGRIYLGPWAADPAVIYVDELGQALIHPTTRTRIGLTYINFLAQINSGGAGLGACSHVVYSPTAGIVRRIDKYWIDNAFDTVRSRGVPATTRTGADVPQPALGG